MFPQLVIEVERDEDGFHAVVIDLSDDAVLHVSDSFHQSEAAEAAARRWIERHQ